MIRTLVFVTWATAAFFAWPATAGNKLIPQGTTITVANSPLTVTPDRDWNKMGARPGRSSETWTIDGASLNDVTFYGAIANDTTLFREVDRKGRPLPRFSSTMLLTDLPTLFEDSYSIALNTQLMKIDSVEPTSFLGHKGIHFSYTFSQPDEEVRRRGDASAAIVDGRLYMITFEAPDIFYYSRDLPSYRSILSTARLAVTK